MVPIARPRVAVLGLDAAEWNVIEPLLTSGDLPHLARLREAGACCRLRQSTPLTEQPWAAFLTGVPAALDSIRFDPTTGATFEVGAPRVPPFYARLPGLRAVVLDVPRMTLAYAVEGGQVTGWGGHHLGYPRASNPYGWLSAIERQFGPHPAYRSFHEFRWHDGHDLERFADRLVAGALRRVEILRWLAARVPGWELLLSVASEAHSAGEILWHGLDGQHPLTRFVDAAAARRQLCRVYVALDAAVGRLARELPADTVLVVCSLHGMQRNDLDVPSALLPELLARVFAGQRLLVSPDPAAWRRLGCPPVEPGISAYAAQDPRRRSAAQQLRGWLGHHARVRVPGLVAASRRMRRRAVAQEPETRRSPDEIREYRMAVDGHLSCRYRELWPRMKAFALPTYTHGRVRVNLRGRERDGIVAPEAYDAVCSEVEATVRACRNPRTGRPIVEDIVRAREGNPVDPETPSADLIIVWKDCADALEHPEAGLIGPLAYGRTGSHSPRGFAIIAGPGIPRVDLGERSALDLTPTIVALLGHEPPGDMCGRSLL
jgi:predicted AlkP superfamily phosphohydrolase/phosphomutase